MRLADLVRSRKRRVGGQPDYQRLPARVRERITRQQQDSEILIGWIQLGVLLTFTALYAVSPKTFPEQARFEPVPWALGAYFTFTIVRLVLAYRRALPYWMLVVSVIADMTLLLGLIWSFHLQYEQPPAFYLKAPTLLYVFIFIALRALRFEVGFVVLAGIAASLGWMFLALYAIDFSVEDMPVTRDYIEYMTSSKVLIGAEFDKIISVLMVTAILAVAIARAHRLLVRSVVEASAAHDLSRFVPDEIVERITRADQPAQAGQGETGVATILFVDLEGFTAIGESLTPEALVTTLNDYFAAVAEPIRRHHGVICQFQGDAILASFNMPKLQPDHAAHAIDTAVEIQRLLARRTFGEGIRLKARVGIATGEVVGGLVGTPERLGYTVHGDDVNLAARLEKANKEHGTRVLISERTQALAASERFSFRPIGTLTVRGRRGPVGIYTLAAGDENGPAGAASLNNGSAR